MKKKFFSSKTFLSLVLASFVLTQPFVSTFAMSVANAGTANESVSEKALSYTEITTLKDLTAALSNKNIPAIKIMNDIVLTANLSLNHDMVISGGDEGVRLNFVNYQFNANANSLTLAGKIDIELNSSAKKAFIGSGSFIVDTDSKITVSRAKSLITINLIEGFKDYLFKSNSEFEGTALTNIIASNQGGSQSAIIHSSAANSFILEENAKVTLTSDSTGADKTHGTTALSLKKIAGKDLNIFVDQGAELVIDAAGTTSKYRSLAPVIILSPAISGDAGKSYTTIKGSVTVNSKNGNGWYYQYIDYATTTYDSFVVDGGNVNITADGGEVDRRIEGDVNAFVGEYAAFEHYGPTPLDLVVKNGGQMNVKSNGWRAMSLAGGLITVPKKTISVDGNGSKLSLGGGQFAIAAEGRTDLTINVTNGGHMMTKNTQDSNVYTTGKATYNVIGEGSKLEMVRTGVAAIAPRDNDRSLYGVIFHDAPLVGPLSINVKQGGYMSVENSKGSRAAITTQSRSLTDHSIVVDGEGSTLKVINNNTNKATAGDTALYPVGAIAFAANCSGNIEISDGGNFYAESYSPDSPTIALGGYINYNFSGTLTLKNAGEVDIKNNAASATKRAVAFRGRNYDPEKNKDSKIALIADTGELSVYPIGEGMEWENVANSWESAVFEAPNKDEITVSGGANGDTFKLSDYGRITTAPKDLGPSYELTVNTTGHLKVNRKVILQGAEIDQDEELYQEIIKEANVSIDVTPITEGVTADDIKIDENTEQNDHKEMLFKKAGSYKITLTVAKDKKQYSFTKDITIIPDEKPEAGFALEKTYYRGSNSKANIEFTNLSQSNDGDTIKSVVYKIIHDANNDGIYDETPTYVTDPVAFVTEKMGKYQVEQTVTETYTNTIPHLLDESDYLSAVSQTRQFSILNHAPNITAKINKVKELELVLAYADVTEAQKLEMNARAEKLKADLEKQGFLVTIGHIAENDNSEIDVKNWDIYEHLNYKGLNWEREHSILINRNNFEMYGYQEEAYKDFLFYNDTYQGEKTFTFTKESFKNEGADYYKLEGGGVLFNTKIEDGYIEGFCMLVSKVGFRIIRLDRMSVDAFRNEKEKKIAGLGKAIFKVDIDELDEKHDIKLVVNGRYITLYDNGEIVQGYGAHGSKYEDIYMKDLDIYNEKGSPSAPVGYGFGPITGHAYFKSSRISYFHFNDFKVTTTGGIRGITNAINTYDWKENVNHVMLYASNSSMLQGETNSDIGLIAESAMNHNVHFVPISGAGLKDDYDTLLNQIEESTYLDIANINGSFDNLEGYIKSDVFPENVNSNTQMLITDKMESVLVYKDPENDPMGEVKYRYVQINNGGNIESISSGVLPEWKETGTYQVYVKASDRPIASPEYAEWSDDVRAATIKVHQRPVANYAATIVDNAGMLSLNIANSSYDPDGGPLMSHNWKWKKVSDEAWKVGLPAQLERDEEYLISLTVVDEDGAISRKHAKYLSTITEEEVPVAADNYNNYHYESMVVGAEDGWVLTEDTDVTATITSDCAIKSYQLQYKKYTDNEWNLLAEGTGEVINGVIATIPVHTLDDDEYEFKLTIVDEKNVVQLVHWLWYVQRDSAIVTPEVPEIPEAPEGTPEEEIQQPESEVEVPVEEEEAAESDATQEQEELPMEMPVDLTAIMRSVKNR